MKMHRPLHNVPIVKNISDEIQLFITDWSLVKCISLIHHELGKPRPNGLHYDRGKPHAINLPLGWDNEDLDDFLSRSDISTTEVGFNKMLDGVIWFKGGAWATYDIGFNTPNGISGVWRMHKVPPIPAELMNTPKERASKLRGLIKSS